MTSQPVILIIDDEAQIRRFLRVSLEAAGYRLAGLQLEKMESCKRPCRALIS